MSKIKCAYIYPADHQPLPTKKEMEKQFGAKVLYGLGKHKKSTPAVDGIYLVEHAFTTVRGLLMASQPISACTSTLVAFDETIDGAWFSLATRQSILTKFTIDEQTTDQMHELNHSIGILQNRVNSLQSEMETLQSWYQKEIGDQQFLGCVRRYKADVLAFSSEVQRVVDIEKARLVALFSSGW